MQITEEAKIEFSQTKNKLFIKSTTEYGNIFMFILIVLRTEDEPNLSFV